MVLTLVSSARNALPSLRTYSWPELYPTASSWEDAMDTLKLCRAMEAVCVQHALSDTRLRERWLDLMDDWNIRAHNEAARRLHENHDAEATGG
jgi:hypothetical protein